MKKGILFFLVLIILSLTFVFVACSSKSMDYSNGQPDYADYTEKNISADNQSIGTQERKIIYTAYAYISVNGLNEALDSLYAMLTEGEWVEQSQTSGEYAQIVLRIKSERLNVFMSELSEIGTVNSSQLSSEDVSLSYYDTTLSKQTLENEYSRLNELLNSAESMSDILTINKRLAEIEGELQKLQNKLNNYDSLIEYSRVTLKIYKNGEEPKETTFGDKVGTAYNINGKILEGLGIFLIAILPYLAFGALVAVLVIVISKQVKKKKQAKANKANDLPEDNSNNVIPLNGNDNGNK